MFHAAQYHFNPYALPMLATGLMTLALGVVVLIRERASFSSLMFCVMTVTGAIWLLGYGMMYCAVTDSVALAWAKLAYAGVVCIPAAVYHFSVAVLRIAHRWTRVISAGWAVSLGFMGTLPTTTWLVDGLYRHWWGPYPKFGWLGGVFLGYFFVMMVASLRRHYWAAYRVSREDMVYRRRAQLFLIAFGIAYLGSFDYLPQYGVALYPFGYLPVFAFVVLSAMAIWRYRLMDITPALAARSIMDTMTDALVVLDAAGVIQLANPAACRLFRKPEAKLISTPLASLPCPWLSRSQLEALLAQGVIQDHEITLVGNQDQGGIQTLSVSASVLWDQGRTPLAVVCIARDISRRKQLEQELDRYFNESLDLLCIASFDGYFKRLNPAWERVLGFTTQELMAKPYLAFVHPDDRAATLAQARKLTAEGLDTVTFENRYQCKDGSYRWLAWTSKPLDKPQLIYAAARDITERKRTEGQLKQAYEELKHSHRAMQGAQSQLMQSHQALKETQLHLIRAAKLESVGQLAAGVAHEVKNPLAIILMGVNYLSKHLATTDEHVGTVFQDIKQAVRRADTIVKGLLDFSAPKELQLTRGDLHAVIEQALLLLKHEMDRTHVTVVRDLAAEAPRLDMDAGKIEQVFVNIFLNAIQAMPAGGTLTVRTTCRRVTPVTTNGSARRRDETILVEVGDTGPGIAEHAMPKLFDPFFTTKPTGQGTGLGLAVSKGIVELHQGIIEIANRPEGGARVTIMLRAKGGEGDGEKADPDRGRRGEPRARLEIPA